MPLPLSVKTIEDVEESARGFYRQVDDGFVLDADGLDSALSAKQRVAEFRENNIALKQKLEDLEGKLNQFDPEEIKALRKLKQEVEGKKPVNQEELDDLIHQRTSRMREEYDGKLTEIATQADQYRSMYETTLIDSALSTAAAQAGVMSTAMDDVMLRARNIFKVVEGRPVPIDKSGEPLYGKDGTMTPVEWVKELANTAPHLFKPSTGANALGSQATGKGRVKSRADLKTAKDKAKYIGEHGHEAYLNLPA